MSYMNEEIISFSNKNGKKLYGIVHIPPPKKNKKIGVNILNPGIKNRVAPHRLNVKIARKLSQLGYYVMRFDPSGIGDSEGEILGKTVPAIWRQIQEGLFVDDVIVSNEYFNNKYNLNKIILVGSCGGAITAILAAERDSRISKLVLIDTPINLDGEEKKFSDQINSKREADRVLKKYSGKIIDMKSIIRFISFKSDYLAIIKALKIKLSKSFIMKLMRVKNVNFNQKFNYKFLHSFNEMMRKKIEILFIIAENDPSAGIFYEDFYSNYLIRNKRYLRYCYITEIRNANHIYSLNRNQNDLFDTINEFI